MVRWQEVVERSKALVELQAPNFREHDGFKTQLRKYAYNCGIDRIEFREMDVGAILVKRPDAGHTIVLNKTHSKARHRFSIAHEIAHLLVAPILGSRANHRRKLARGQDPEGSRIERLCDSLAAAILMPEKTVSGFAIDSDWSANCLPRISKCFDVSFEATARRFVGINPDPCALVTWRTSQDGRPIYVRNTVASDAMGRCWIKFDSKGQSAVLSTKTIDARDSDCLLSTAEDVEITRGYADRARTSVSKGVLTETLSRGRRPYRMNYSVLHFGR